MRDSSGERKMNGAMYPGELEVASASRTSVSARVRGGRVVALRLRGVASIPDIELLHTSVAAAIKTAPGPVFICGDYRRVAPLSRSVSNMWSRAMRRHNPRIARSALLVDPANEMFNLQFERIVHCAGHPTRRLFSDRAELLAWLDGELSAAERDAIRSFFSECDG